MEDMEKILEEAKLKYVEGVEFVEITTHKTSGDKVSNWGEVRVVAKYDEYSPIEWIILGKTIYCNQGLLTSYKGKSFCSNPNIYQDGKWAPIITPVETYPVW